MWPFTKKTETITTPPPTEKQRLTFRPQVISEDLCGPHISAKEALKVGAWHNGVKVIAGLVATPPLMVYTQDRQKAKGHPLWSLLHDRPNPHMGPYQFRAAVTAEAVQRGSGYAEIVRDGSGRPRELWPVPFDAVTIAWQSSRRWVYLVTDTIAGTQTTIQPEDMLHVTGLPNADGVGGMDTLQLARDTLSLAKQCEDFANAYFANNAATGGWVQFPPGYPPDGVSDFMKSLRSNYTGARKAFRWGAAEEGIKVEPQIVSNETNKLTELRAQQITMIAQHLNLSPVWLQDLTKATWANLGDLWEHLVRSSLMPFFLSWEHEGNYKLRLSSDDVFIEHQLEALLRGNETERYTNYKTAIDGGWLSPETVAQKENLPPPPSKENNGEVIIPQSAPTN